MIDLSPSVNKTYEQQRYERLTGCIDEYLGGTGDEMGAASFLCDLKKILIDIQSHHLSIADECISVSDLLP